jgi:hypothetical protein
MGETREFYSKQLYHLSRQIAKVADPLQMAQPLQLSKSVLRFYQEWDWM